MSALTRVPLAFAGGAAVWIACAQTVHPLAGLALGTFIAGGGAMLAAASWDAPRRRAWAAVALVALATAATGLLGPLPAPDLTQLAVLREIRAAFLAPLYTLVPAPENAILAGIVLGDRADIPRDLRDAFAVSGTAHLLAISGSHMTIVGGAVAVLLRGRARPGIAAVAALAAVGLYAVLVGPLPSVIRSTLMSGAAAAALLAGRAGVGANALGGAVAIMVAADPRVVGDVGFALSAAATAGLIALHRPVSLRLSALPGALRDALALTVAATVPTVPLLAATFGRIPLVSPVANLAAVPIVPPLMLFGAATSVVGALSSDVARPLAIAAFAFARALRLVSEGFASLPLASLSVPSGPLSAVGATVVLISAGLALARARPPATFAFARPLPTLPAGAARWPVLAVAAVALVAGPAIAVRAAAPSSAFKVRALDVGQGDAYLLESDGRYALVDGGPDPSLLTRRLGEALAPWQRRIDLVLLTHEHADHGAGLLAVIDRYDVGLAVEPAGMNDVPLVRAWSEHLAARGIQRRAVAAGDALRLGRLTLRILAPGRGRAFTVPSLVIRAEAAGRSILFMGDATDDAVGDLLLEAGSLQADVYVPPHHGAPSAHGASLVAAVRPELAVLSVGASNRYGHPSPQTLEALAGVPVYRTDLHGTVEIGLDGARPVVRTAKTAVPADRRGPVPSAAPAR